MRYHGRAPMGTAQVPSALDATASGERTSPAAATCQAPIELRPAQPRSAPVPAAATWHHPNAFCAIPKPFSNASA